MPAVAEVQFKAAGNQQVVTAFKSVGTAAGESTSKIQQNSSAMKSMGQGMKGSVSGIGQVATAFATLSLSIVSTWRAYRDLGDAQIAVDKANLRVKKTTEAIRKSEAEVAKLRKESAKGGLENVAATHKIQLMEQKLAKDRKEHKKTALELKVQEDAINLARKEGVPSSKKLTDAENKLALQKEQLGVQTEVAGEAQERFNDIQQDFYLSILPLGLSSIASLTTAFKGLGSVFRGGGGLIGGLGPISLILGGITLAIIAFKTNFLGLRDAVGGVINWLKERFGVWKQTLEDVFNFIRKGDWGAAFNKIREAAVAFWQDLKRQVPILTAVETVVNAIRQGKWKYAFDTIVAAAEMMWFELKKKVPFFAGAEVFLKQLFGGDLKGAFATLAAGVKTGLESVFGKNAVGGFILKIQEMKDTAVAEFNLMKDALTKKGGPLDLIQQGLAKLGSGDIVGGFSQIWKGVDAAIAIAITRMNDWVKLNFGIDIVNLANQAKTIGATILGKIGEGLTTVANAIDPFVAMLFDPAAWMVALTAIWGGIQKVASTIWTFFVGVLTGAAKDPKGAAGWWSSIGQAIWDGITGWMEANLPDTKKAMEKFAQGIVDAFNSTGIWFQNIGIGIWNNIIDGLKKAVPIDFGDKVKGWLESLKKKPIEIPATVKVSGDTKPLIADSKKGVETVNKMVPKMTITAQAQKALQIANQTVQKINKMTATIRVSASAGVSGGLNLSGGFAGGGKSSGKGAGRQHGYQGTVKRPTAFIAGEGGRPEDVTVRPRGSAQRGGSGGGGGATIINVYVDGILRPARYDMGARK